MTHKIFRKFQEILCCSEKYESTSRKFISPRSIILAIPCLMVAPGSRVLSAFLYVFTFRYHNCSVLDLISALCLSVDPPLEEFDDEQQQDTSDPTWDPSLPGKPLFLDFDPIFSRYLHLVHQTCLHKLRFT